MILSKQTFERCRSENDNDHSVEWVLTQTWDDIQVWWTVSSSTTCPNKGCSFHGVTFEPRVNSRGASSNCPGCQTIVTIVKEEHDKIRYTTKGGTVGQITPVTKKGRDGETCQECAESETPGFTNGHIASCKGHNLLYTVTGESDPDSLDASGTCHNKIVCCKCEGKTKTSLQRLMQLVNQKCDGTTYKINGKDKFRATPPTDARRRLGWKPSHDIPRRRDGFHHSINRVIRESKRQN